MRTGLMAGELRTTHSAPAVVETSLAVGLALAATGLPVLAHLVGQPFGVVICAALGGLIALFAPAILPAALIASYLFQNFFVSLISPWVADPADFDAVRAYNFVFTTVVWLIVVGQYLTRVERFTPPTRKLMAVGFAALGVIGFYFALGLLSAPKDAAVYLRNIATPFFLFQIGLVVSTRAGAVGLRPLFVMGWLLLAYGLSELLLREELFYLINGDRYLEMRMRHSIESGEWVKIMQETGRVIRDIADTQKVALFNTPLLDLDIQVYRLLGPNFHSISYAYALSYICLLFFAVKRPAYILIALPLMLVVGSKGALILLCLTIAFVHLARVLPGNAVLGVLAAVLASYAAATIVIGLQIGDYHVIGLMGGIDGFLRQPIGRGLGVGGNLSVNMAVMDMSRGQALGRTDVAVESAIGVLLYQMGIAALAVCAAYAAVALAAWRRYLATGRRELAIVAVSLLALTTNGLFQEEALFAPLAAGALMLLAGIGLGSAPVAWSRAQRPAPDAEGGTICGGSQAGLAAGGAR